jgi:glycosyltransferase involved in cell wall biosynthesis
MSARPRLAYVVHSLNPGGTEKLAVEMAKAFSPHYQVHVLCLDEPGLWARDLRDEGIPVSCCWRQPGLDFVVSMRLARYLRELRADIIHAHQGTPWFYAALSRLLHRVPRLLFEEHGRFYPERENKKRACVNRWLVRRLTHGFVAVSKDVRSRLERYEGLDSGDIEVVYNGVTPQTRLTDEVRQALRRELGFAPNHFVVGTVGRFDPIKNLPLLVGSIGAALGSVSDIRGLLVGDGPLFAQIQGEVERAGLGEAIKMPGFREDARNLIQCMDLFVLSSFSEGTSMALLEAMAASVPVVVTDVGGNPEIVLDGESGTIVPSGAVGALTAAIVRVAKDPEQRRELGDAGRRRFEKHFTFAGMIERYDAKYAELLASASGT